MSLVKRSIMTLYSGPDDIYSHQVRIVLAEKGVGVDIISVDENQPCEVLGELNPYQSLPTLVDRELVLYQAQVIMEYLDERFPHPPLLPVYPVVRAKHRLMLYRIERDWYKQVHLIMNGTAKQADAAREALKDTLLQLSPIFSNTPYFLSEEFTLVDCCLAPLFWRLSHLGITLPKRSKATQPIYAYAQRLFERASFQASLTEVEREWVGTE